MAPPPVPDRLTLGAFTLLAAVAGLNFVGVKVSNHELAPFWGAGLRFALAGLLLGWFVVLARRKVPTGRALVGAVVYGALGFGAFYAFAYYALVDLGPGLASVLLATVPLVTFFVAWAHRQERFGWRPLAGGAIAVGGTAVVFWDQLGAGAPLLSLLALLLANGCYALGSVTLKRFPVDDLYATSAVAMLVGGALLLALSALVGEVATLPARRETWIALVYLVLPGSVLLMWLFLFVLGRWTASATSYLFVVAPLFAIAASAVLVGEEFRAVFLLGAALVLWGTYEGALRRPPGVPG